MRRFEALSTERSGEWEREWQDASDYILPRRGRFQGAVQAGVTGGQRGQRHDEKKIDGYASWAAETFAGGMQALVTPQSQPWFAIETVDEALMRRRDVKEWLQAVNSRMLATFANPSTRFYSQAKETYLDIGTLGTAVMYVTAKPVSPFVSFQTRHLAESHLEANDEGLVNANFRHFRWTARQAVQAFSRPGDRLPEKIRTAAGKPRNEYFRFLHAVFPRTQLDGNPAFARNKPWASTFLSLDPIARIREGGFEEFPYVTPRWSTLATEVFGRGPGNNVMSSIKLANAQKKTVQQAAVLKVRPPMQVPEGGLLRKLQMRPGGVNYLRSTGRDTQGIRPVDVGGDVGLGVELMGLERDIIDKEFMTDLMQIPELDRMTATEILERRDLRLLQVAPIMAQSHTEFVDPLLMRTFRILARAGQFPPAPQALAGQELRIQYKGTLAIAQRLSQTVQPIMRVLDTVDRVAVYDEGVKMLVDGEEVVRLVHDAQGAPVSMLRSADTVADLRRQASEAAERQQLAELAGLEAATARDQAAAVKDVRDAA